MIDTSKEFEKWWRAQSLKGDPIMNIQIIEAAFEAGHAVGYRDAELDSKDIAAEARWKEQQGEEYGSY